MEERNIYHEVNHGGVFEKKGKPDLTICYKGLYIGIELKVLRVNIKHRLAQEQRVKDLRPAQRITREQIIASGGIHRTLYSVEELKDLLNEIDKERNTND